MQGWGAWGLGEAGDSTEEGPRGLRKGELGRSRVDKTGTGGNYTNDKKPGRGLDRELSDVQIPPPKEATQVMGVQQCWETEEPKPSGKEISL